MTLRMFDAAYLSGVPSGCTIAAGYVGGDALHDWPSWPAFTKCPMRLPIWVRSDPGAVGAVADAAACLAVLRYWGVPRGCWVALDLETAQASAWVHAWQGVLRNAGYRPISYGSSGTVFANPGPYWVADPTGDPSLPASWWGKQYSFRGGYDLSSVADANTQHFWGAAAPDPKPAPDQQEENMATIPIATPEATFVGWAGGSVPVIGVGAGADCDVTVKTTLGGDFPLKLKAGVKQTVHFGDPAGLAGCTVTGLVNGSVDFKET
jgi:hypothetical protein